MATLPRVGLMVYFISGSMRPNPADGTAELTLQDRAAVITDVADPTSATSTVHLTVFLPNGQQTYYNVRYAAEPGGWQWPPEESSIIRAPFGIPGH